MEDSITIRISGKEITTRLFLLESKTRRLEYIQYFQTALLLVLIGRIFLF